MAKPLENPGISSIVMIGAGLCAALLFTVLRQGTFQAMALAFATPLPIMISTIGFGPLIGIGSAALAVVTVALLATVHQGAISNITVLVGVVTGVAFALALALPAWWLGFISCLARTEDNGRWRTLPADKKQAPLLTFYPVGQILLHAAIIVICVAGATMGLIAAGYGGYDEALVRLSTKLSPLVEKLVETRPELSGSFDAGQLTQIVLKTMPAIAAVWNLIMFLANLWLAGRVVQTSNKLARPWPNIALELRMPRLLIIALAAAIALSFVHGWPGTAGLIIATTLGLTYALQGLAVLHEVSRGWRWRLLMLFGVYTALIVFIPWPLAIFVLIGIADTALSLRDRKAALLSSKS